MRNRSSARGRAARAAVVALSLLVPLVAAAPAPAATDCSSPPPVYPIDQLHAGMTATGYTTIQGSTPTEFDVQILGVMSDYIWLDIDAIVVRITGPQSFIDEVGGVFYGMSGSPIYIGGQLVGAVSYAVSSDPTIFGLTPGQPMVDLFGLSSPENVRLPKTIPFDATTRHAVADATGVPPSAVSPGLDRIPTYLGVSGLSGAQLERFQQMLDDRHAHVTAAPGGGMPSGLAVDPTPFQPGEPVGSVLAWGDFTIWAAGTVAATCQSELVAYGHSLFYNPPGRVALGLTGVDVLAVGKGSGWPGDMVPSLTAPRGTVVQDRFSGQVGVVGQAPPSVPITSTFSSPDTGLSRSGETDSIFQDDYYGEYALWGHMNLNLGAVEQALGPGTLGYGYTIEGTGPDGRPFTVENRAMFYSSYDATYGIYKMINAYDILSYSKWGEDVQITGIDATGSITADRLEAKIVAVHARRTVHAGDRLKVDVTLKPIDGAEETVTLSLEVPRGARGQQTIELRGGKDRTYLRSRPHSFDALVRALNGGEHGNDLIATGLGPRVIQQTDLIVTGRGAVTVRVVG